MKSGSESSAEETAQYIAGMARELRTLAAKAELGFLAYLLSMVEHEATKDSAADARNKHTPSSAGA